MKKLAGLLVGISGDRTEISACACQPTFLYSVTIWLPVAAIPLVSDKDKGNEGSRDEFWLSDQTKILWRIKVCAELARLTGLALTSY